jgi:DNA-binding cell septation regulator SpoVG
MEQFTNLKVFKNKTDHPTVKGNGSVIVGGVVEVKFTILSGSKGLFVALPSRTYKDRDGNTKRANDVSIPDKATYTSFQKMVIEAFEKGSSSAPKRERSNKPAPAEEPTDIDDFPF